MSVDAGLDVNIDPTLDRPTPTRPRPKGKKRLEPVNFNDFYKRYAFVANLIAQYPDLRQYYEDILDYYNKNNRQMPPSSWLKEKRAKNPWFEARNSNQQAFDIREQDPRFRRDVETAIQLNRDKIVRWAGQRGIDIPPEILEELSRDATRNKWADDEGQLELNLGVFLGQRGVSPDARGTAGDFETQLQTWATTNGINLSPEAVRQYVERLTLRRQTLEDAKQEIRNNYMIGAFPAWEEQIRSGTDPNSIVSPYRDKLAKLLELSPSDLTWEDPMIQKAMQGVDADGKPRVVPLWEYEREIRKDDRWQKTNNAYETYAKIGNDLLRMFGLR